MAIEFNADEILHMATRIEQNGREFYLRATEIVKEEAAREVLQKLADMEIEHEELFIKLKSSLTDEEKHTNTLDPYDENAQYLNAFARGHVFELDQNPADNLKENMAIEEVLLLAMGFEKDSILFYLGLKELVPPNKGREQVNQIIKEEMGHLLVLSDQLKKYTT